MRKFVGYYRVSSKEQMLSHLSIEKQQHDIREWCARNGELIGEFIESASASKTKVNRPQLKNALELCAKEKAILVIQRLDRLSRRLVYLATLMDSQVKFIPLDIGEQDEFTTHIFAATAQREAKMISNRTKDALQAKRMRGEPLGNIKNLTQEGRLKGAQAKREKAINNENTKLACAMIREIVDNSSKKVTFTSLANRLNEGGFTTSQGCLYSAESIKRLYYRIYPKRAPLSR